MNSWIDLSIIHSILTGCLLLIALLWSCIVYVYLWQEYICAKAGDAFVYLEQQGFQFQLLRFKTQVVMQRTRGTTVEEIVWVAGIQGEYSMCNHQKIQFLQTPRDCQLSLDLLDEISTPPLP